MKTHRKVGYTEEIKMLKVVYCIWFVESGGGNSSGSSNNRARYYSRDIIPSKSLNQTYMHV